MCWTANSGGLATCHTDSWWSFAAPWSVRLATIQATLSAAFTLSDPHLCGVPVCVLQLLGLGGPLLGVTVKGADGPAPLPQPGVHVFSLGVLVSGSHKMQQSACIVFCVTAIAQNLCRFVRCSYLPQWSRNHNTSLPPVGCKPAAPQGSCLQSAPLLIYSTATSVSSASARHSLEGALA